jgi:hypothetical protein
MMLTHKSGLLGFTFLILSRVLLLPDSGAAAITPPETASHEGAPVSISKALSEWQRTNPRSSRSLHNGIADGERTRG